MQHKFLTVIAVRHLGLYSHSSILSCPLLVFAECLVFPVALKLGIFKGEHSGVLILVVISALESSKEISKLILATFPSADFMETEVYCIKFSSSPTEMFSVKVAVAFFSRYSFLCSKN